MVKVRAKQTGAIGAVNGMHNSEFSQLPRSDERISEDCFEYLTKITRCSTESLCYKYCDIIIHESSQGVTI